MNVTILFIMVNIILLRDILNAIMLCVVLLSVLAPKEVTQLVQILETLPSWTF
jgi:hypothetical protein